jgi:hypothetical protein
VVSFSLCSLAEHNIRVHVFTCVLALQLARLMQLRAARAGHQMSARALLCELAAIRETVLIYPSTGGKPKPAARPPNLASGSSYTRSSPWTGGCPTVRP